MEPRIIKQGSVMVEPANVTISDFTFADANGSEAARLAMEWAVKRLDTTQKLAPSQPETLMETLLRTWPVKPDLGERFARVVREAARRGVTVRITATPDETMLSQFTEVGDPTDLAAQLDITEAYAIGVSWPAR